MTESLTTDLSRIAGSFVIARNTAFTYKGKPNDVKQIGRELNVRYVRRLGAARREPHAGQRPADRHSPALYGLREPITSSKAGGLIGNRQRRF